VYFLESNFISKEGRVLDLWSSGALILGLCVVVANFKILTFSHNHSFFSLFIIFGSIGVYVISFFIISFYSESDDFNIFYDIFSVPTFYFGNLVIIVATSFFDLAQEKYTFITEGKITKRMKAAHDEYEVLAAVSSEKELTIKREPSMVPVSATPGVVKINLGETYGVQQPDSSGTDLRELPGTPSIRPRLYSHTGYAFSEEERYNKFNIRQGIEHPQN